MYWQKGLNLIYIFLELSNPIEKNLQKNAQSNKFSILRIIIWKSNYDYDSSSKKDRQNKAFKHRNPLK